MAQYDGSIRIGTQIDTNGIRRGESDIRGSISRISSTAKRFAGILGAALLLERLFNSEKRQ